MITLAGIDFTYSLIVVILSYLFILIAILRMNSAEGRRKAFSTCGSHLTAVVIFYGTLIFMYLRRPKEESVEQGKMVAVFYTTVIPMLNPMIYSLRNRDVKEAMNKVIGRILTSQNKVVLHLSSTIHSYVSTDHCSVHS